MRAETEELVSLRIDRRQVHLRSISFHRLLMSRNRRRVSPTIGIAGDPLQLAIILILQAIFRITREASNARRKLAPSPSKSPGNNA